MVKLITLIKKFKEPIFLIFVFLISLLIRRIGMRFGYPLLTHPDEATILTPVYTMTVNKTLNPGVFNRPNQILYLVNFIYLNLVSYFYFGRSLATTFIDNQLLFYFYARLLIGIMGAAIPIAAYYIGKEYKVKFAVPAAFVFAFFPSFVIHSHYITPDIPITLFTLLIILFTIKYVKSGKEYFLFLATAFAAINTAEKYPGLVSFFIILMGILLFYLGQGIVYFKQHLKTLILLGMKSFGVFIGTLYMVAPNIFIEFGKVIQSLILESRSEHLGADHLGWLGNMLFYVKSFGSFTNILAGLFLIVGCYAAIKLKDKNVLVLLYGIIYWIILSRVALHWERWALPMYITPLLILSLGMGYLLDGFKNKKWILIPVILISGVFVLQQFLYSLSTSIQFSFPDTRVIALEYSNQQGITPENSVYEGYTPFNPQNPGVIFDFNAQEDAEKKYIFLSSNMYHRYYQEAERYQDAVRFYETIREENLLIQEFKPTDLNHANMIEAIENIVYYLKVHERQVIPNRYNGPIIQIFEVE